MDIKIPSGPPGGQPVDPVSDLSQPAEAASETAAAQEVKAAPPDAVSKIAEQVAAGELTRDEAVDLLLAEVMDGKMVKEAPASVRAELAEALRSLIETDPYLTSLTAAFGPSGREQ